MAKVCYKEYEANGFQMKRPYWCETKDWETDFKEGVDVRHVAEQSEKYRFVENYNNDKKDIVGAVIINRHGKTRKVYKDMIVVRSKPKPPKKTRKKKTTKAATKRKKRTKKS